MFKTVSLPESTWAKIIRRLTVEVGADDASRLLAGAITEQTSGSVVVKAQSNGSISLKVGKAGGDLRGFLGLK